jgi:tight adherence protein C
MSGSWPYLLTTACFAIAVTALAMLGSRSYSAIRRAPAVGKQLPAGVKLVYWPALIIAPLIAPLLAASLQRRTARALDSNGLYPPLTPELWFAARLVHGVICAIIPLVLAGSAFRIGAMLMGIAGFMAGGLWLRRITLEKERRIVRELPAYLDLLTVCVEAGATLTAGVRLIVLQAPDSPLRSYFDRVLREVRGGRPRAQAFVFVAEIHGVESLTTLANALAHAESAGMSLGQILRTQSEQRTTERFARAERLAMQAPVKMLGPLIFCIFPCTFIVLAVPIAVRLMEAFRS